jgi:sugar O-acyltransferase (sialic acid O-acetyltransferase NeuD family)
MSLFNDKKLIMLGAGGHAMVLMDMLALQHTEITAFVSPEIKGVKVCFQGIEQFFSDEEVLKFSPDNVMLINGIGFVPNNALRAELYAFFKAKGYQFKSIISPHAIISPNAKLNDGVQILHRAVVQAGAVIKENTLINTAAVIEHDCVIGTDNHIAPSATLCGTVTTQEHVFIGSGATVIPNITIGKHAVIAAGAVITKNVAEHQLVYAAR